MLKFIEWPKIPGMTSKKNISFPEGNKQFCSWFCANLDEKRLIWFSLQRDGARNGLSNIKETFAENLYLQMSVLHQVHVMAGQNAKKKYLMCQIPIKMLKQHVNASLHNLNIYSSKRCRKTSQRLIYVASYVAS